MNYDAKIPEIMSYLKLQTDFSEFTDEELLILQNNMMYKRFHAGQVLFDQNDERNHFFFNLSGVIKTQQWDDNDETGYYKYIGKDKAFPYRGLFSDEKYSYLAEAVTDIEIVYFPMVTLENLLRKNNCMAVRLIKMMGQIIDENEDRMEMMFLKQASTRVLNYLQIIGTDIGNNLNNGSIYIPLPITITQIASDCSISRETASVTVKKLVNGHIIKYQDKHFTIL